MRESSGDRRLVNASAIEAEYRTNVDAFLSRWRTTSRADGIDYALMSTDEPPEQ